MQHLPHYDATEDAWVHHALMLADEWHAKTQNANNPTEKRFCRGMAEQYAGTVNDRVSAWHKKHGVEWLPRFDYSKPEFDCYQAILQHLEFLNDRGVVYDWPQGLELSTEVTQ